MNFADLGLSPDLLRAVAEVGYTTPTPIQEQAIPHVLMSRDVLGCAQTGTGKTASFTLPMVDILAAGRAKARMPRSLILEPTRELAAQVSVSFETYGKYCKLNMALLIGGEGFADQERKLDRGVDVLIATPGRLLDLIERGKVLLSDVKILVIDEADRMLDMGFIPDVERIVGFLPKLRQTLFFSATMPPEIRRLADAFLMNPKEITVAPPASPAATVAQFLTVVDREEKREALRRLIRREEVKNAIIFCNRKRDVDILFKSLRKHGFDVVALHGDMAQSRRMETLEQFKSGAVHLMVASDVAARGIDIQGLSHVFNFDVPIHAEDYIHRIGRTGRAGREGRAFTIAAPEDGKFVDAIVKLIGKEIPPVEVEGIETLALVYDERRGRRRGKSETGRVKQSAAPPKSDRERRKEDAVSIMPGTANRASSRASALEGRPLEGRQGPKASTQKKARPSQKDGKPATVAVFPAPVRAGGKRSAPARDEERSWNREDDGSALGFGDHLPAFLARPVRVAGKR
jgi:superfamily II DNA/RNA helicase